MPIVSSTIILNRPDTAEADRRVRVEYTDHSDKVIKDGSFNTTAENLDSDIVRRGDALLERMEGQEVQSWIDVMEKGEDPAHIGHDGDTWFTNSEPVYNTWEKTLYKSLSHFFKMENRFRLLDCKLTCSRLTSKELEAVAGKPNDVLAEQSIAQNAENDSDSYIPILTEEGFPRG